MVGGASGDSTVVFQAQHDASLGGFLQYFLDGVRYPLDACLFFDALRERSGKNANVGSEKVGGMVDPLFGLSHFLGPLLPGRQAEIVADRSAAHGEALPEGALPQLLQILSVEILLEVVGGQLYPGQIQGTALVDQIEEVDLTRVQLVSHGIGGEGDAHISRPKLGSGAVLSPLFVLDAQSPQRQGNGA